MTSTNSPSLRLRCIGLVLAGLPLMAAADPPCKTISLSPGANSTEIQGVAPPEGVQCLRFSTEKGQTVRIAVKSPKNQVAFTLDGMVDNREKFQFTSEKRSYDVLLHQMTSAAKPVDYALTLSIK